MQRTALLGGLATQLIMIIGSWNHGLEFEWCRNATGTLQPKSVDNSATPSDLSASRLAIASGDADKSGSGRGR